MPEEMTIDKLMQLMPAAFIPEKAGELAADVQFHFEGDGGGDWVARIRDGACTTERATVDGARLTLTVGVEDWLKIVTGELNAMSAFAQGKIKLKGDLSLAMKLMDFFKLPA